MKDDELKVVDTEDIQTTEGAETQNKGTRSGEDTGIEDDGRRPTGGMGTAGPKLPGNDGGKDQYSLGHGEEDTETPPTDEDEEDGE